MSHSTLLIPAADRAGGGVGGNYTPLYIRADRSGERGGGGGAEGSILFFLLFESFGIQEWELYKIKVTSVFCQPVAHFTIFPYY